jgi:hypothetical protein
MSGDYQLVRLNNGICSVRSLADAETFHPVTGPAAEAEALYVNQLQIRERLKNCADEFVIWDVGLGAAANAISALRATREISGQLRIISFDRTREPLEFALKNSDALNYFSGYENQVAELLRKNSVQFENEKSKMNWQFQLGDFPTFISKSKFKTQNLKLIPPPRAIFYDAYSPAKNPAMWTLPHFTNLFHALDLKISCALATYSRSTILRTTLLLAGFFVGVGHAIGLKEETTIAANDLNLISEPLDSHWLDRARRSHSAAPLTENFYRIAPLTTESWEKLRQHPQFS